MQNQITQPLRRMQQCNDHQKAQVAEPPVSLPGHLGNMAAQPCDERRAGDIPGRRYGWVETRDGGRARVLCVDDGRPVVSELRRLGLVPGLMFLTLG